MPKGGNAPNEKVLDVLIGGVAVTAATALTLNSIVKNLWPTMLRGERITAAEIVIWAAMVALLVVTRKQETLNRVLARMLWVGMVAALLYFIFGTTADDFPYKGSANGYWWESVAGADILGIIAGLGWYAFGKIKWEPAPAKAPRRATTLAHARWEEPSDTGDIDGVTED